MRASAVSALGVVGLVAGLLGCAETQAPCAPGGSFVADDDTEYCVYSVSLPIVIEGGFVCPNAMRFELQLNTHHVCSARAFDGQTPPPALCAELPEACLSNEAPRPLPEVNAPPVHVEQPNTGGGPSASRDPMTWTSCDASTYTEGITGDLCTEDVRGCGESDTCGTTFAMCDPGGTLVVSELDILDCPGNGAAVVDENAPVFSGVGDCAAALEDGHSFQACEGSFICARPTEESCCIEYALCNAQGPLPTGKLVRYRFCEPGCTNIEPDDQLEPITDCSPFASSVSNPSELLRRADVPCEGDFVCWDDHDLSDGGGTALTEGWLRWCSEGVVRGQRSTIGYTFIPNNP